MQRVFLLSLLISCSSLVKLDESNSSDTHSSTPIAYHQMGLEFTGKNKRLGEVNEKKLNSLSQKAISTSQPIKKIQIFSNPHKEKLPPKEELINYDRAVSAKRFLERDLHSQSKIEIQNKKESPYKYDQEADILILIEYM